MKKKKWYVYLLKAPLFLLVIASFIAAIYAAVKGIQGITITAPIILGLILVAYGAGLMLDKKQH